MLVSRIGVRAAAVALLVAGVAGGVYLNSGKDSSSSTSGQATAANAAENATQKQDLAAAASLTAEQQAKAKEAATKAAQEAKLAADRAKAAEDEANRRANRPPSYGPIPTSCKAYTGAKAIGCSELLKAGFGLDQMPCLDKLWTRESHWNYKSYNKSSGAFGIPQAVPGDKMKAFGADWQTNPATQIKWGLDYIEKRYKTPCGAWQHSEDQGWY